MEQVSEITNSEIQSSSKSVDEIPFSLFVDLYRDLRDMNSITASNKVGSKRGTKDGTRKAKLSRAWLTFAGYVGITTKTIINSEFNNNFIPAQIFAPKDGLKLISLIVPTLDSAHGYLGMKEAKISDALIKALDLSTNGPDALWLKHYREREYRPRKWRHDAEVVDGNFPSVVKAILKERCPTKSSLKLKHVWDLLNVLSQEVLGRKTYYSKPLDSVKLSENSVDNVRKVNEKAQSQKAEQRRFDVFRLLIQNGTAEEVSEICRIILRDLDMRLSDEVFLNWFHPAAKQHHKQAHDISQLLKDCYNPEFQIGEASVQLGRYASVMLTMRPSRKQLKVVCEKLCGRINKSDDTTPSYFFIEPKLDGERMQLHKWVSKIEASQHLEHHVRTFTRRGYDSTDMFGQALHDVIVRGVKAENVILDGEIMIWDVIKGSWLAFEHVREVSKSIANRKVSTGSQYKLKYMVFDVLYIEQKAITSIEGQRKGSAVLRMPLFQRRELLSKIIKQNRISYVPGVDVELELVKAEHGRTEVELIETLQRYETIGYEGVIGKNPDMPYCLAERNLEVSIKLKPDYFDGGIQDLDVLILGARYSSGSGHRKARAGNISTFLVGVQAGEQNYAKWTRHGPQWEEEMKATKWVPIANVGTGYSENELIEIRNKLEGEWREFDPKDLPAHFTTYNNLEFAPVLLKDVIFWIPPWKSMVLTVRAYELHRKLFTLRFPRVQRVNWEKPYYDVPTCNNLIDLDETKLPATIRPDEADADEISAPTARQKKKQKIDPEEEAALERAVQEGHLITGGRISRGVIQGAAQTDISNISQISKAFNGMWFFVLSDDQEAKQKLEIRIHELGGMFGQNLINRTDYVVCTSRHLEKARTLCRKFKKAVDGEFSCPIIEGTWIEDCYSAKALKVPRLVHVIFVTKQLENEWYATCDRFGDAWKEKCTISSFEECLEQIDVWKKAEGLNGIPHPSNEVRQRVFRTSRGCNIFQQLIVYVPSHQNLLTGSISLLQAFGGSVVSIYESSVTHVLLSSQHDNQLYNLNTDSVTIIDEKWIAECIKSGCVKTSGLS